LVEFINENSKIEVTPLAMVTLVRLEHPSNVSGPMEVTVPGIVIVRLAWLVHTKEV
jgi:hypothetical protein